MLKSFCFENETEAGCDEAGRGCLAGPVFAAAVILPRDFFHPLLNDSKQMSEEQRYELRPLIQQHAVAWAVGHASPRIIDRINILKASILSMHKALDQLVHRPSMILVDGNRFKKYKRIPHQCVVKGDGIFASIAAASVLAKTYRDDHMLQLHQKFPEYNWKQNKGYPTVFHREVIMRCGTTVHHRMTFNMQLHEEEQGVLFAEKSGLSES
ncbi:MAG TPA: ribonuclease HII [Chitinophagales bacterium]|nr:ribonuclease HII [Chitinophagales bacterium]